MQTINEKIEKYLEQHAINLNQKFISAEIIAEIQHDAFLAGVGAAQQWINVDEELPERDSNPSFNHQSDFVLLKNKSGNIFSGYYDYDTASFFNYYDYDIASFFDYIDNESEIIEWRPIELN